jgi:glycerol-3-phosphate dehydrogenase
LAEAAYAAREEMVLRLNDFLWRRTKWAHYRDLPAAALDRIAEVLARELGWTLERKGEELGLFDQERRRHRLPPQDASV